MRYIVSLLVLLVVILVMVQDVDLMCDECCVCVEVIEYWQLVLKLVVMFVGQLFVDVIVLFDGNNLDVWQVVEGGDVEWIFVDGVMIVVCGKGDICIRQLFCDVQLYVEW